MNTREKRQEKGSSPINIQKRSVKKKLSATRHKAESTLKRLFKEKEKKSRELLRLRNMILQAEKRLRQARKDADREIKKLKEIQRKREEEEKKLRKVEKRKEYSLMELKEAEENIQRLRTEEEKLKNSLASVRTEMDAIVSKIENMKMAEAMLKLLLAADPDGIESWLSKDAPLLLEYVKQSKSASFMEFYKKSLYEALLRKAYHFYSCQNCGGRFHTEGKEPNACPYCSSSSSSLRLLDVIKEASPVGETGISLLPSFL